MDLYVQTDKKFGRGTLITQFYKYINYHQLKYLVNGNVSIDYWSIRDKLNLILNDEEKISVDE